MDDDDDDGNVPKLNAGFNGSVLLLAFTLLAAFGFGPPQQAHLLCAYERNWVEQNHLEIFFK